MRSTATAVLWALALSTAIFSSRYFLSPPVWVPPPLPEALTAQIRDTSSLEVATNGGVWVYQKYPARVVTHIACGVIAMCLGLVQFIASLRSARPALHRLVGTLYVAAVTIGSLVGAMLTVATYEVIPVAHRREFMPLVAGFGSLSVAWLLVTAMAYIRARQRRLDDHRAWMIRSYALTFAAVTVRLAAPVVLLLSHDAATTTNVSILTWPLNLFVAEWLIRERRSLGVPARAGS